MAESNRQQQQPNRPDDPQERKANAMAAGAQAGVPVAQDATAEQATLQARGGRQEDQISGETERGAHNNEMKGANPQGNKPNQNRSSRQEGNEF